LQEGRENANIDAGWRFIWRISVKLKIGYERLRQEQTMNGPNIAAYSEDFLGISDPNDGGLHSKYAIDSGLTTVILGQLHINASEDEPIRFDTIHYNNTLLIEKGTNKADLATWQKILASIKANFGSRSSITKIYASIGGQHPPIKDFQNISFVYDKNNKSFDGTMLKKNLNTLKVALPAIDGIDMDNEEWYDIESFNEFCRMVHEELHWDITFSVFGKWHDNDDFWQKAIRYLWQIKCPLKWINLQMYYEGGTDPPHEWAKNIKD
jgi:hypothetical protein